MYLTQRFVVLSVWLLLTVSCSGASDTETAQAATAAPPMATTTPRPTLEPDNLENQQITADQHDWEYVGFTHTCLLYTSDAADE